MQGKTRKVTKGRKLIYVLFWLAVWQIIAAAADNAILLAGPAESAAALLHSAAGAEFWKIVLFSSGRICLGFLSAFVLGVLLGSLAGFHPMVRDLLAPLVNVSKAVPVAVFTVILLIWSGSTGLTVWVCFLIVFPQVYTSMIAGLESTDKGLLEMAQVMGTERWKKVFFLYRPAVMPYLEGCCRTAFGTSWKSGIAAEVIGTPAFSIGERIYLSKVYLDTAGIFAWTFVIIVLSVLFEKGFMLLLGWYADRKEPLLLWRQKTERQEEAGASGNGGRQAAAGRGTVPDGSFSGSRRQSRDLLWENVSFAYGSKEVLGKISMTLHAGRRYCLAGKSGRGKTTFLHLTAGLLQPDSGRIARAACGVMFQEDRLCEQADAVWNVCMGRSVDRQTALYHLRQLLEEKDCLRPVSELSGGMRRRVALCRAAATQTECLLLDEPFNGLDETNRERAAGYLLREQKGRTIVTVTHREEDAGLLQAELLRLE